MSKDIRIPAVIGAIASYLRTLQFSIKHINIIYNIKYL